MLRAFLSHSPKDSGFVHGVADQMRPGTYELDAYTFDAGAVNSAAIIEALQRSTLFCLFLSEKSVRTPYVQFETLISAELLARGGLQKFLAICLDEAAFEAANSNVKFFNIVRRGVSIEAAARLIEGALIAAQTAAANYAHPFLGRSREIEELEKQVSDFNRPPPKGLFISGIYGSGRRTLTRKFYQQQYPEVGKVFPAISIEALTGLEELYRSVLAALRPSISISELKTRIASFRVSPNPEKLRQIADVINSLLPARDAAFIVDNGGLQTDEGTLNPEINAVVDRLDARPHPPAVFIARRMIQVKSRRPEGDLAYVSLGALKEEASENLVSRLVKDLGLTPTREQVVDLAKLADGHPFNFYRIADEVQERGIEPFLANPHDFIEWKHRHSSEYLRKIELSEQDVKILALLRLAPELDFTAIVDALHMAPALASDHLSWPPKAGQVAKRECRP